MAYPSPSTVLRKLAPRTWAATSPNGSSQRTASRVSAPAVSISTRESGQRFNARIASTWTTKFHLAALLQGKNNEASRWPSHVMKATGFRARCEKMVPERDPHACVPVAKALSSNAAQASSNISASSNGNAVATSNKAQSRNARWRVAHPEPWRRVIRDYIRRKRAAKALGMKDQGVTPRLDAPEPKSVAPRK